MVAAALPGGPARQILPVEMVALVVNRLVAAAVVAGRATVSMPARALRAALASFACTLGEG